MTPTLDDLLQQFQNHNYRQGSEHQKITLESKQLFLSSTMIVNFLDRLESTISDDSVLFNSLFISVFTLGRMYERQSIQ
jgi:hypothetical protein